MLLKYFGLKGIKSQLKTVRCLFSNQKNVKLKPPWSILFFGNDDFSLCSLQSLYNEYRNQSLVAKLEIVTSAGKKNCIRKFANENGLFVHEWPIKPTDIYGFHAGIVVSFGHLIPANIINAFPLGMINVHASLLPRWRGAAPIIYAIANGDKQTGVTVMKIRAKKFDCGDIILQRAVDIPPDMVMWQLYKILAEIGAETLVHTIREMPQIFKNAKPQTTEGITLAPRVTPKIANVDWKKKSAEEIYNLARALDGLFYLTTHWHEVPVKLHNVKIIDSDVTGLFNTQPGSLFYDKSKKLLLVLCKDGRTIGCEKIGMLNRRLMSAADFNNGFLQKKLPVDRYFK